MACVLGIACGDDSGATAAGTGGRGTGEGGRAGDGGGGGGTTDAATSSASTSTGPLPSDHAGLATAYCQALCTCVGCEPGALGECEAFFAPVRPDCHEPALLALLTCRTGTGVCTDADGNTPPPGDGRHFDGEGCENAYDAALTACAPIVDSPLVADFCNADFALCGEEEDLPACLADCAGGDAATADMTAESCRFRYCTALTGVCDNEIPGDDVIEICTKERGWDAT